MIQDTGYRVRVPGYMIGSGDTRYRVRVLGYMIGSGDTGYSLQGQSTRIHDRIR